MIYLDNAATTKTHEDVVKEMLPYFTENYGNASSVYDLGSKSKLAITKSRETIAAALNAKPEEIYFTAGGSESDNWALKATAEAYKNKGKHIITSKIEHHAILHTCEYLEREGYEITYLDVDERGLVDVEELKQAIRPDTILISVMFANNEIGTIQPIEEIAAVCREKGVLFHTDAVQAMGHVKIDVHAQGIDMLSLSGHKIHAQKGIGALYVRKGIPVTNLIFGGAQERNRRAGTENLPAIAGFAKAMEIASTDIEKRAEKTAKQRDRLIEGILKLPRTRLNGDPVKRLPGTVNISIEGVEGESLLLMLDLNGICASSGSACTSGSLDPSHVLLAIGLPHEIAHGSLRMTLGEETTREDLDYTVDTLKEIVANLRSMSPLYEDFIKKQNA